LKKGFQKKSTRKNFILNKKLYCVWFQVFTLKLNHGFVIVKKRGKSLNYENANPKVQKEVDLCFERIKFEK